MSEEDQARNQQNLSNAIQGLLSQLQSSGGEMHLQSMFPFAQALSGLGNGKFKKLYEQLRECQRGSGSSSVDLVSYLSQLNEDLTMSNEEILVFSGFNCSNYVPLLLEFASYPTSMEINVLSLRCLVHLLDIMPVITITIGIRSGNLISCLCDKLLSLEYLDMAELAIGALDKICSTPQINYILNMKETNKNKRRPASMRHHILKRTQNREQVALQSDQDDDEDEICLDSEGMDEEEEEDDDDEEELGEEEETGEEEEEIIDQIDEKNDGESSANFIGNLILSANGAIGLLQYCDFFPLQVQRKALQIIAFVCQDISKSNFSNYFLPCLPLLHQYLLNKSSDKLLLNSSFESLKRLIESKEIGNDPCLIEAIATPDICHNLLQMISASSNLLSHNTSNESTNHNSVILEFLGLVLSHISNSSTTMKVEEELRGLLNVLISFLTYSLLLPDKNVQCDTISQPGEFKPTYRKWSRNLTDINRKENTTEYSSTRMKQDRFQHILNILSYILPVNPSSTNKFFVHEEKNERHSLLGCIMGLLCRGYWACRDNDTNELPRCQCLDLILRLISNESQLQQLLMNFAVPHPFCGNLPAIHLDQEIVHVLGSIFADRSKSITFKERDLGFQLASKLWACDPERMSTLFRKEGLLYYFSLKNEDHQVNPLYETLRSYCNIGDDRKCLAEGTELGKSLTELVQGISKPSDLIGVLSTLFEESAEELSTYEIRVSGLLPKFVQTLSKTKEKNRVQFPSDNNSWENFHFKLQELLTEEVANIPVNLSTKKRDKNWQWNQEELFELMDQPLKLRLSSKDCNPSLLYVEPLASLDILKSFICRKYLPPMYLKQGKESGVNQYQIELYHGTRLLPSSGSILNCLLSCQEEKTNVDSIWDSSIFHDLRFQIVESPSTERKTTQEKEENLESNMILYICRVLNWLHENNPTNKEPNFENRQLCGAINRQLLDPVVMWVPPIYEQSLLSTQYAPFLLDQKTRWRLFHLLATGSTGRHLRSLQLEYKRRTTDGTQTAKNRTREEPRWRGSVMEIPHVKLTMRRDNLLADAMSLWQLSVHPDYVLDIEFANEIGTGLGPTMEFYSSICEEIQLQGVWISNARNSIETSNAQLSINCSIEQNKILSVECCCCGVKQNVADEDLIVIQILNDDLEHPHQEILLNAKSVSTKPKFKTEAHYRKRFPHEKDAICQLNPLHTKLTLSHSSCSEEDVIHAKKKRKTSKKIGLTNAISPPASNGLFPSPTLHSDKIANFFQFVGMFVSQALVDSRLLTLPFSELFLRALFGECICKCMEEGSHFEEDPLLLDINSISQVNSSHGQSLLNLYQISNCRNPQEVEEMGLSFVFLGNDMIELTPKGAEVPVTSQNIRAFLVATVKFYLHDGIQFILKSIRKGMGIEIAELLPKLFNLKEIQDELLNEEDNQQSLWTREQLQQHMICAHGYTSSSQGVLLLIDVLMSLKKDEQRLFLRFVTGSPRLPIGGLEQLQPKLTVVKKENELNSLPSASTCTNYLKLPEYPTAEIMLAKLRYIIHEGQSSFHLS